MQHLVLWIGKRVDDGVNDIDKNHGRQHRERDFPELLPFGGALHLGCLKQRAWNRLQGGKEYEDLYTGGIDHTVGVFYGIEDYAGQGAV